MRISNFGRASQSAAAALVLTAMLGLSGTAKADMNEAQAAFQNGDIDTAFVLWRLEAAAGNPEAMWYIGNMYAEGTGVDQDIKEAADYYAKGAALDHTESQVSLATLYRLGLGVPQDAGKAAQLLYEAARVEHPIAMFDLAEMFFEGDEGEVAIDEFHARQWYRLSAKKGVLAAQLKIAELHFAGKGVAAETASQAAETDLDVIGFIWLEQAFLAAQENRENYWSRRVFPLDRVVQTDKDGRTLRQVINDRYLEVTETLGTDKIEEARGIVERGDLAKL